MAELHLFNGDRRQVNKDCEQMPLVSIQSRENLCLKHLTNLKGLLLGRGPCMWFPNKKLKKPFNVSSLAIAIEPPASAK